LGQRVRTILDAKRGSGKHKIQWDGRNDNGQSVATGVYIYRMKTENDGTGSGQEFIKSRKMLLIR
ncbi:MAG: hypothetical protein GWN00_37690, partial [Aliifodinibius sp.]|nr:hypothetical protein [candidate division Zixibacteria bacterium]NIT61731.1 hypothetical protein [Fodinibius sp.]NIS47190.1 hypothetical protein [candidate division Zixibacteria bacterium]NIU15334.1 hypothetical protein [candidate division Zixibacteria bacterium]NIV07411.1 hypothetical protein [candidate division Zixibacteria bacterium]